MEKKITLCKGKRGMTHYGHPWIYRSQIGSVSEESPGDIYAVHSASGFLLGKGYYNPRSEITVRLFTYKDEVIDEAFFESRIKKALQFRNKYVKDTNAYRVVSSEADGLPGLIVDKYADHLVFQILTLGMEKRKETVVAALKKALNPAFIYEKSDAPSRKLEGMNEVKRWWEEEGKAEVEIFEGKLKFIVDISGGHKTGFYLDQRDSRRAIKDFVKDKKVLDCFSYTGGFSVYSSFYGAKEVLGIDIHKASVELANRNAKLNGLSEEKIRFKTGNIFNELKRFDAKRERFDVIILDPPSFVKSKNALEGALTGYKEINLRAFKILDEGGILATFSCSGHIEEELFLQVILDAAFDAKRGVKILNRCSQPLDHPVDPFIPQTLYLKGLVLEAS